MKKLMISDHLDLLRLNAIEVCIFISYPTSLNAGSDTLIEDYKQ